jgi:hypothetical protein
MSFLKEEFDLLLNHDWEQDTKECIKEIYKNLLFYKYLLSKVTIENISKLINLANNIKIELQEKDNIIQLLQQENEELKLKFNCI